MAVPHAVVYPFPTQGHINPMVQLVRRLLTKGFYITFISTEYNHDRIIKNGSSQDLMLLPNLRFVTIPDGLPPEHGRINQDVVEFVKAIVNLHTPLKCLVKQIVADSSSPPVTCIIADSLCAGYMQDVADAVELPRVTLWTTPVHANLAYCAQSRLISEGIVPLKGKGSQLITGIPGLMPLRASDFISFFEEEDYLYQWMYNNFTDRPKEAAWNLGNNVYELESASVDAFRQQVKSFLPVGPLLPSSFFSGEITAAEAGASLWPEESKCQEWLDKQKAGSVLYISCGSIVNMSRKQAEELTMGLEASGQAFLWVLRTDALQEGREVLEEFVGRIKEKGLVVNWAPQLVVLKHRAVGGFVTHCGWNSLMEGMSAGVRLLAWPGKFAEQNMNARYLVDEWKIGIEFEEEEGVINRQEVEKKIRCLMRGEDCDEKVKKRSVGQVQAMLKAAISEGGSACKNLDHFVEAMTLRAQASLHT